MTKGTGHISDLPENVLKHIFGKLPLWSQWQIRGVCKEWRIHLSSSEIAKSRSKEPWIIVNASDQLLWYNINQNRWIKKKMPVTSLSTLPLQNARLSCVSEELLFFHDESIPPCIISWNAVTGESRLEEILLPTFDPVDQKVGAYVDKTTDKLKLLVYFCAGDSAKLYTRNAVNDSWKECSSVDTMCSPNFNNLSNLNRVAPFLDAFRGLVHLYDVESDSFTTLESPLELEETKVLYKYHWNATDTGGQFHFRSRGSYVVGLSISEFVEVENSLGVFWFDEKEARWRLVGESPQGLVTSMMDESGRDFFFFCSDGEENIWALQPSCSRMMCYNVVSNVWITLPSTLNNVSITSDDEYVLDEHELFRAMYTLI